MCSADESCRTYRKTIMALGRENYFLKQQFGIANGQVLTLGRDLSSATEELHRLRMLVASLEQRHGMSAEQLAGLGQASVHDREMSSMQHEFEMASMHSRRGQREMPAAHLRMYPGYSGAFPHDSMSSGYSGAFLQDSMSSCSPLSMSEHSYNGFGTSSLTSSMASSPLDPSRATPPGISSLDAAARRRKKGRVNRAAAAARSAAAAATSKNGNHSGRNRLSGESNSGSGESDATDVANGIAENKDSGKDGRGQEASDKSEKSEQGSGADETSSGTRSKGATKEEEPKPRFWTAEEHARFLEAVRIHGFGNARAIAAFVGTRNITQVRTHAQKYILKLSRMRGKNGVAGATGHKPSGSGTSEVATPVLREDADQSLSFLGGEPPDRTLEGITGRRGTARCALNLLLSPCVPKKYPVALTKALARGRGARGGGVWLRISGQADGWQVAPFGCSNAQQRADGCKSVPSGKTR